MSWTFKFVVFLLALLAQSAHGQDRCDWKWVRMGVYNDGWEVQEGDAAVIFNKLGFTAKLFSKDNRNNLIFSVTANVKKDKVTALEVRSNSDGYPVSLAGTLKKFERLDKSECRTSIMLGEPFNHLGLVSVPLSRKGG